MGNKTLTRVASDTSEFSKVKGSSAVYLPPIDMAKAKTLLAKLDTVIFPGHNIHYILLRADPGTPVMANATWSELDLNQADCSYIFSKIRMTAKHLATTLCEIGTQGIHMRGEQNIWSYYAIGEYCLIVHRELRKTAVTVGAAGDGTTSINTSNGGTGNNPGGNVQQSVIAGLNNAQAATNNSGTSNGGNTTGDGGNNNLLGVGTQQLVKTSSQGHITQGGGSGGGTSPNSTSNSNNTTAIDGSETESSTGTPTINSTAIEQNGGVVVSSLPTFLHYATWVSVDGNTDQTEGKLQEVQMDHLIKQLYELLHGAPANSSTTPVTTGVGSPSISITTVSSNPMSNSSGANLVGIGTPTMTPSNSSSSLATTATSKERSTSSGGGDSLKIEIRGSSTSPNSNTTTDTNQSNNTS